MTRRRKTEQRKAARSNSYKLNELKTVREIGGNEMKSRNGGSSESAGEAVEGIGEANSFFKVSHTGR